MIVYLNNEPMEPDGAHSLAAGLEPVCVLHKNHTPRPLRLVAHHIHPVAHGGRTVNGNLAVICDTGHYNVHTILDVLLGDGHWPARFGSPSERAMARRGYELTRAADRP